MATLKREGLELEELYGSGYPFWGWNGIK